MLASCIKKQEAMLSTEELRERDILALHIAVMPAMSCLPVFYAQRLGMTDSAGLDIRLVKYQSQMDIDTAICRGHADIAFSDIIRSLRMYGKVTPFLGTQENVSMIAIKGKRVKKVNQMSEKMIAVSRLCITDFWCDQMLDSARMSHDSIYRPQINDITLRAEMIRTGLLDGAMMCEPYSSWMIMEGNKRLFRTDKKSPQMASWVIADSIKTDSFRLSQVRTFIDVYKSAIEKINKGELTDTVRRILVEEYGLPSAAVDSIKLSSITQPFAVRESDINTSMIWLQKRKALPKGAKAEVFKLDMQ